MKKVESCVEYLVSLTDVGKNFKSVAEVKTHSIINACGERPDLATDTFLVIGPNIIPYDINIEMNMNMYIQIQIDMIIIDNYIDMDSNMHINIDMNVTIDMNPK